MPIKNLPRHVLIPAFLIDDGNKDEDERRCESKAFTNIIHDNDIENTLVADACLRSAAAPSYYKPYQNYVDGGVIDNVPCGLAWPYLIGEKGIGIDPDKIVCLSISAGRQTPNYIDAEKVSKGGLAQWAPNIVELFMLSRRSRTVKDAELLLGDRFFRMDPALPGETRLDNVDDIDTVKTIAETCDLEPLKNWMRKYWE